MDREASSATDASGAEPAPTTSSTDAGIRPSILQLLSELGAGPDERGLYRRPGGAKDDRRNRAGTGIRSVVENYRKVLAGGASVSFVGILSGWYFGDLFTCLSQELASVRLGPALVWVFITLVSARLAADLFRS